MFGFELMFWDVVLKCCVFVRVGAWGWVRNGRWARPILTHRTQQPFIHMDHPKMQSGVTSRHIYQLVSINFLIGCWIGKLTQVDVS